MTTAAKVGQEVATLKRALQVLQRPPKLNVWQWAEAYRNLPKSVTARPGPYSTRECPYQIAPQEDFTNPVVQVEVFCWASRLGKTEMLNNLDGYHIHHDPATILKVYPTLDSVMKWSKKFFMPMVRATMCLWRLLRDKSRDAANTILSKQFPGGQIDGIGTNSPSGFRQIQARVVTCDEIDAMEVTAEGDPVLLAFKRADNYPDSVQVVSSSPTLAGVKEEAGQEVPASRIWAWLEKSDFQKWWVPCPRCRGEQVLLWDQVKWPAGEPERAGYVCELCHVELSDAERVAMVKLGKWKPSKPFTGIRGYWLNGLNTTFPAKKGYVSKLHQLAAEYLDAQKQGESGIQTWKNTVECVCYEAPSQKPPDWKGLSMRCEPYGPDEMVSGQKRPVLPRPVLVLTCALDVQHNRLEAEVVGWGENQESWGIELRQFFGNPNKSQVWKDFEDFRNQTYLHASGVRLPIAITVVDSSDGNTQKAVYGYVRPKQHQRVYAIKGSSLTGMPLVRRPSLNRMNRIALFSIGTDVAKSTIYTWLEIDEPGERYMHFPQGHGYDDEYFQQLTAEEVRGFPKRTWHKVRSRNEALDLRVYSLAAFDILKPIMSALAKQFPKPDEEKPAPVEPSPPEPAPPAPPKFARPARRPGFVAGWRR